MPALSADDVREVARRLAPHIRQTPLIEAPGGGYLKLESMQPTGSFKVRGFFNAAHAIDRDRLARGLLSVSAGNAALACAYVAHTLQVPCRVVMYENAPRLKLDGVRALGAEPVLLPREGVIEWIARRGWEGEPEVFVHPFANDDVIRGHSSIVPEILADCPDVERVLVPVGGGGLICGVALGFVALKPDVQVVGVQSDGYPSWPQAFAAGGAVAIVPATIADGSTAPFTDVMFERLGALVHEWIVVPEVEMRSAIARLATTAKVVAEGAGALAFTAMELEPEKAHTVAVLSGGNLDPSLLAELLTA
ncbi:MAG TPA: pyridoxal-phosphate dependent enzyme [Candidatus Dormibacteraeota bacterium]